jgi:hypothetical protein
VEIIYIDEYEDALAGQLVKESELILRQIVIPRVYGRNGTNIEG